MMRKLILAAVALPLLSGVALARGAGSPGGHGNGGGGSRSIEQGGGAIGPFAYADWQQRWAQAAQDPAVAAMLGLAPGQTFASRPSSPSTNPLHG